VTPNASTRLYALIGHPAAHSLGPVMHNAVFRALGCNAVYLAFDTQDPAGVMAGVRAMGIRGISVTVPHKTSILPFLDRVDDTSRRIGAVNTVLNHNGFLTGFNTDATGFLAALRTRVEPEGRKALVVGAGGVARAVAFALSRAGARVTLANRSRERGEHLARTLACPFVPLSDAPDVKAEILIQATSVGMEGGPEGLPVSERTLRKGMIVVETVYRPAHTPILLEARSKGCVILTGLEMFFMQGAEQIRIWTGLEPPLHVMRHAVFQQLRGNP